ncbi:hypothetical protein HU200_048854 [Digitaria exilis]|uniref:Protein kinase domain-containing protein n=1 Tax=Digitaria exilis TaxID=1010633 RepID=A0A835ECL6_9POAL|nr:hypothetical protein HU200_048854 [Digitaria exilis]
MLKEITNDFSQKIGHGGYGEVYKGVYNGKDVAVKKLYDLRGLDDNFFKNELNSLMRVHHQNIVQLLGYCYEIRHEYVHENGEHYFVRMDHRVLCFEYLHGGSLDKHLYEESAGYDWCTRYKIIKGICVGLNYLHAGLKNPNFHLDLKPANILLDKNMVPKIADFGLSRLFSSTHSHVTGDKFKGTLAYVPPEYIHSRHITDKYDIFSLGIIIIQIITGAEGHSKYVEMSSPEQFIEHVHNNWRNRLEASSMHVEEYCQQVQRCIKIASNCLAFDRKKRPTIGHIINELLETETVICEPFPEEFSSVSTVEEKVSGEEEVQINLPIHFLQIICFFKIILTVLYILMRSGFP